MSNFADRILLFYDCALFTGGLGEVAFKDSEVVINELLRQLYVMVKYLQRASLQTLPWVNERGALKLLVYERGGRRTSEGNGGSGNG